MRPAKFPRICGCSASKPAGAEMKRGRWAVAALGALLITWLGMTCVGRVSGYFLDPLWNSFLERGYPPE